MRENVSYRLPLPALDELIRCLRDRGYRVLGPVVRDGAVGFDRLDGVESLPLGLQDDQQPGRYRLAPDSAGRVFGVVNGPGSLKSLFFAPSEMLLRISGARRRLRAVEEVPACRPVAVIGVRSCDLAAVSVQDRVFLRDGVGDAHYAARRRGAFLVAVNCTRSASTCFCGSLGTGPRCDGGYDLALTELDDVCVLRPGSAIGESIVTELRLERATAGEGREAEERISHCARTMRRRLDTEDLPQLLYEQAASSRWEKVAERCLSCTSCTMVCPTCFCHTLVDLVQIAGEIRRVRQWDSCLSYQHAHIHGKNFRPRIRDRYRQWLTHKLGYWVEQFGVSGCVGCGRCITWCPVGIDLTEVVAALRAERGAQGGDARAGDA